MVVAAIAAPSTVSDQIRFFVISSTLLGRSRKVRDRCGSGGHAVLNSAIWWFMPDAVAPVPPLAPFAGPLPGVLLGFISCQCLAFWAGVKLL